MEQTQRRVQPFVDWFGIWGGYGDTDFSTGRSVVYEAPSGVKLSVLPAERSEPFFTRERPWERHRLQQCAMLYEDEIYKLWYIAKSRPGYDADDSFVCYAWSRDGFHWQRPELGLYEYQGSAKNNILHSVEHFSNESIFIDENAPACERYKSISQSVSYYRRGERVPDMTSRHFRELRKAADMGEGYTLEALQRDWELRHSVEGAVSEDGLRWNRLKEPLLDVGKTQLDTANIAAYDADTGEYVAYLRGHLERRRLVRRTAGKDFGGWSKPQFVFMADVADGPDTAIYQPCYCRMPGSGVRVMLPSVYHQLDQELDIQLAVSRDGLCWDRPERMAVIPLDKAGGGRYSCLYAFPHIVPLHGDRWGVGYAAYDHRHLWYQQAGAVPPDDGEFCWAAWKQDRMVALCAPVEGRVTLIEREMTGNELKLNFSTGRDGWVKVELVNPPTTPPSASMPLEGFGFRDADTLTGDHLSRTLTWNGSADLSSLRGRKVSLRITMARAKVFAVKF